MKNSDVKLDERERSIFISDLLREKQFRDGIDASISDLIAKRSAADRRIAWLESLVGEWKTITSTNVASLKDGPDSLRARIRQILDALPDGAKPRDVLNILKKQGYEFNGKTDPATRISSELWRMAKIKDIESRDGRYFPVAKGG
jgi:hypothetical protein